MLIKEACTAQGASSVVYKENKFMIKYEMLVLMRPDLVQEKQDEIQARIELTIKEEKGTLISYDKWGKYLLAYPIQKCTYGIYSLVRFSVEEEHPDSLLEKLKTVCAVRFSIFVMRHVIIRLALNAPTEYRRPDSLEEAPRRDKSYDSEGSWEDSGSGRRGSYASRSNEALGDMVGNDMIHIED